MTEVTERNTANVRIYCDETESRWRKRIDPKTKKASGGWIDRANWIIYPFEEAPGCLDITGNGESFPTLIQSTRNPPEPQVEPRTTISVRFSFHAS